MTAANFHAILKSNRARLNARFAEARHFYPLLDADTFSSHLRDTLGPLVESVAALDSSRAESVLLELYDLSLELVGREFLGPRSHYPAIVEGWQRLLPRLAHRLAVDPTRVAGSVTNALCNLSREPAARPRDWINLLARLADTCSDTALLLKTGQVAAWICGMAHYRLSALDLCHELPASSVLALFNLPAAASVHLSSLLAHLKQDPWLDPVVALQPSQRPRRTEIVKRAGGFRGFGGVFQSPPLVVSCEGPSFIILEETPGGERSWWLHADRFGATLQRSEPPISAEIPAWEPFFRLKIGGEVQCSAERRVFPQLQHPTGSAANHSTMAVTTQFSHWIFLVAQV